SHRGHCPHHRGELPFIAAPLCPDWASLDTEWAAHADQRSRGSGPRVPHHWPDLTPRRVTPSAPKAGPSNAPIYKFFLDTSLAAVILFGNVVTGQYLP